MIATIPSLKRATPIGLTLLCLGIGCVTGSAATRTVGKPHTSCPNPEFSTIAEAITAAAPGDEIAICPALYPEQLVITKPLTLRGLYGDNIHRVLLKPATMTNIGGLPFEAVLTVLNTKDVTIQDLTIDAGNNAVNGCDTALAGIHYLNSSGKIDGNAILGAKLKNPQSCTTLLFGNGFGVQIDANQPGQFHVSVQHNSIHDFTRNGILVVGSGVTAELTGNSISGVGPIGGVFQFGVFIANGAVGQVIGNMINEGTCGLLSNSDCFDLRSEGIVLRAVGDGTVVDSNTITNAQSGIFINGANNARITNNVIRNIDALDGINIQGTASGFFTNSLIAGNKIFNVGPINSNASENQAGCGINEASGTGVAHNAIRENTVNDAYCGVAYVTADHVESGVYLNTLYATLNSDLYQTMPFPPPTEP